MPLSHRTGPALRWVLSLLVCGLWPALTPAAVAADGARRIFDLPAGRAEPALKRLSQQAGVQLVFDSRLVEDVTVQAVRGEFTPLEAAQRLLTGTVLRARRDERSGILSVERAFAAAPPAEKKAPARADPSPTARATTETGRPPTISTQPQSSNPVKSSRTLLATVAGWFAASSALGAQTAPAALPPNDPTVVLSPFEVTATTDVGYQARETIAGGRLRTDLKDVSAQVDVMTQEFISDLGINSLEDALRFSLNIESQSDWYDPSGDGNTLSGNPFNPSAGNRARGLARASTSVGFFETSSPIDSYNTERYTFVGGPNAILFGNGLAGGSVDTSFKRAGVSRNKYSASLQLDSDDGYRATVDLNQVLVKNLVALRFNSMKQDLATGRQPSSDRADRNFVSFSFEPRPTFRLRAYHESGRIRKSPVRSTLVQDKVTPYFERFLTPEQKARFLATYDPSVLKGFDNSAINSFNVGANTTAVNAALVAQGFGPPVAGVPNTDILSRVTSSSPVLILGGAATAPLPITSWNNTGFLQNGPGPFVGENFDWSFTDGSIYPTEINLVGNALRNTTRNRIYGAVLELNPVRNLFIEFAGNREFVTYSFVDALGSGGTELMIDLNRYLPAAWAPGQPAPARAPNPNFGRYYAQSSVAGGDNQQEKADNRVTATYTLDFTRDRGWTRWLGVHRLLGVWTSQMSQRFEQVRNGASAATVVSDNDFTVSIANNVANPLPPALVDMTQANRQLQVRHYLGSPTAGVGGAPHVAMHVDPWTWGRMGVDAGGRPVDVAGENLPGGASAYAISNGRKETTGKMLSLQSAFLGNRIVTSFGIRRDDNTYTSWLDRGLQPRYDARTGQYYFPPSANAPGNAAYNNAPFMSWQDFKKLGLARIQNPASRQHENPESVSKGIVLHPLPWFSLFYNESTSAYAAEFSRFNHDGSPMAIDDGKGRDYGFSISTPNGKFSLRANWYESTRQGGNSIFQGRIANGMQSLRDTVYYLEKTFLNLNPGFDIAGNRYAFYLQSVQDSTLPANVNANTNFVGNNFPVAPNRERSAVQADRRSEGVELTLTANPLPGLALSLRGAKSSTADSNAGLPWFEYADARWSDWESIAGQPIGNIPGMPQTIRQYMQSIILPTMSYMKMSSGMPNPQERKYRLNVTGRYALQRGPLKGFFFGGNYSWRSRSILAYGSRPAEAKEVYREFAGIGAGSYDVPDFSSPLQGRPLTSVDGFLGYRRRIFQGRYDWSMQLNVRNLLDDDELIPQRGYGRKQADGTTRFWITNYNVPDPRRFILTNTVAF
jgi:hypothetical protein